MVPEEFLSEDFEHENLNSDGSIPIHDLYFGVILSLVKTDIDEITFECIMKSVGNIASIPFLNLR